MTEDTPIVIMTYKNPSLERQLTWNLLSDEMRKYVWFAIRVEEREFFKTLTNNIIYLPMSVQDLKGTRQYLCDTMNDVTDYWFLLDDDVKKFSTVQFVGDPDHPPIGVRVVGTPLPREDQELMFDECLRVLREGGPKGPVATVAPRQQTLPPRGVVIDPSTGTSDPQCIWSAQMVIGFNGFNSKLCRQANLQFHTNSYGDQEMLLQLLSKGYDCAFLQGFSLMLGPPTPGAYIRKDSIRECAEFVARWPKYITKNTRPDKRVSTDPKHNPMESYIQNRARLLKDGRKTL